MADQNFHRMLKCLAAALIMLVSSSIVRGQSHVRYEFGDFEVTRDSLKFAILVSSDTSPVRLGTALVLLNYDRDAFGQRIAGDGRVSVATGDGFPCCSFTPYTALSVADNADSRLAITLIYSPTGPVGFGTELKTESQLLFRLSIAIEDTSRDTSIGFDASGMDGQSIQDDNATTFTTVETGADLNVPLYVVTSIEQGEWPEREVSFEDTGPSIEVAPNPFAERTTMVVNLADQAHVRLRVFDLSGRLVRQPVDRLLGRGEHHIQFLASDLPNGHYVIRGSIGGQSVTHKMSIVR